MFANRMVLAGHLDLTPVVALALGNDGFALAAIQSPAQGDPFQLAQEVISGSFVSRSILSAEYPSRSRHLLLASLQQRHEAGRQRHSPALVGFRKEPNVRFPANVEFVLGEVDVRPRRESNLLRPGGAPEEKLVADSLFFVHCIEEVV